MGKKEKAVARLKAENNFMCGRDFDFNIIECKHCKYYYVGEYTVHCLKKEIRDWTLYRINES